MSSAQLDRARSGSKIHLLVDQRGAPIAVQITAANAADKTMVTEVVMAGRLRRPATRNMHRFDSTQSSLAGS